MSRDEPLEPERARTAAISNRWLLIVVALAFMAGIVAMLAVERLTGTDGKAQKLAQAAPPPPAAQPAPVQPQLPGANPPPPVGTDLASLSAREQALAARLDSLASRIAGNEAAARSAAAYATRAEGLLVAFAARRALDRGLGLGYIERELRERFSDRVPAAVAVVIGAAREPVTLEDLRLALDTIAPQLVSGNPDEGIWIRIRRELSSLIVIREATKSSPRPADRLIRARRALDAGNVEAALAEVARLPGAGNAEAWTAAARRHIEARQALDQIELAAIQGGPPNTPPPPVADPAPIQR